MKLSLVLDHACNLRCRYCYTGEKFGRPMPLQVAELAVELALELTGSEPLFLGFFGGEPLLHLELMEQVLDRATAAARRRGKQMLPGVCTNGTLLDERALALLQRWNVHVQISCDGGPEAQDAGRLAADGTSTHAAVEAGLRHVVAAGLPLRVSAVFHPANVHLLAGSLVYLSGLGATLIHFTPNLLTDWDDAACERFESALPELGQAWAQLVAAGHRLRVEPLTSRMKRRADRAGAARCSFGVQELAVSPAGRIYPCDRMVREDRDMAMCIGDVEGGLDIAKRNRLLAAKETPDEECARCELRERCTFWCACANLDTTGDVGRVSPVQCWFERCFIGEADRIAGAIRPAAGAPSP